MKKILPVILLLLSSFGFASDILSVSALSSVDKATSEQEFSIAVILEMKPSLHINSDKPNSEYAIPTVLTVNPVDGVTFGEPVFPPAELKTFAFSPDPLSVFEGKVVIQVPIKTSNLSVDQLTIEGSVSYQGCNDQVCFAPEEQSFSVILKATTDKASIQDINQAVFTVETKSHSDESESSTALSTDEQKAKEYLDKGIGYAIIAFFLVGLALNLTPCVYPVIPLTISYFGGQSGKSKGSSFGKAFMYLIGIAIAFALLGLVSGLAGKQWGFLFTSPWFVVAISTIILAMAASLFGAFEIAVPTWLLTKAGGSREGAVGSFIMGLTVGIVIAPCAAGIIIGLVGLIAKLGLVVKGTLLFFVMGLGLGLPYLFLATFSGLLDKLPQSGVWMVWMRKFFGVLLIGVALYFLVPQLDQVSDKLLFLLGLLGIFGGLLLGFLDEGQGYTKAFKVVKAIIGIVLIAIGINLTHSGINAKKSEIEWIHYQGQTIESLVDEGKPVFIDFYADWCAPCKQLDKVTFTDDAATAITRDFTMLKVDCTKPDAATQELMDKYQVGGMPTLIYLSKSGKELQDLREIGFFGPEKFIKSLNKTLEAN